MTATLEDDAMLLVHHRRDGNRAVGDESHESQRHLRICSRRLRLTHQASQPLNDWQGNAAEDRDGDDDRERISRLSKREIVANLLCDDKSIATWH
jgi:hypothetical protein